MSFKDEDFLEIEYSAWNASDNRLVSTTDEKKAKQADIYDESTAYGPALVVLGAGGTIGGLDRELRGMSLGETKKFTFEPADAFGDRHDDLVKVMPLSAFRAREINPYVGMRVNIDGTSVIVKSVNSGRVVVDGNHPYAGKSIVYEVSIVKNITSENEKVEALGRAYGVKPTSTAVKGDTADVSFGGNVNKDSDYFINKARMLAAVFSNLKGIEKVLVHEEYLRQKEKGSTEAD
jgi:FKBP-type peptidyl-prolyl cis-trans isomerase 2